MLTLLTAILAIPLSQAVEQPKREGPEVGKSDGLSLFLAVEKPWLDPAHAKLGWSKDGHSIGWAHDAPSFNLAELQLGPKLHKEDFGRKVLRTGDEAITTTPYGPDAFSVHTVRDGRPSNFSRVSLDAPTLLGKNVVTTIALKTINIPQPGKKQYEVLNAISLKPVRDFHIPAETWAFVSSPDARFLLVPGHDHTLQIYNSSGKIVLRLFVADNDWIAWTPEGYYAATPGGEQHLLNCKIVKDGKWVQVPIARFRSKLYRPDVIALLMHRDKENLADALTTANAVKKKDGTAIVEGVVDLNKLEPPTAHLAIVDKKLPQVTVKATAVANVAQQPVTALRLLVDGRPLPDGTAHKTLEQGKHKAEAEWTISLPPGKHQLTVLARCPDASSKSNTVDVSVPDPARQHALHVLAIGVSDYEDSALKLNFAAQDAKDIAGNFQKCCKGELYQEVNGDVLIDALARKDAILRQIGEIRKKAKSTDLAVIFFAGHGVKQKDRFYLLSVEAKTDDLAKTAISGDELRKALGEFPCQVLLMLDACHSSAGLKNFRPAVDDITRNLTDDDCGVAVLCSAMAHEKALEKEGNGLFTRAVLDGINHKEGVPFNTESRLFFVHHLHSYVFDRVTGQSGGRQHPFLSLPWVVESFPVAQFAK